MTALTGTARLLRLALRRDRIVLPVWLVALGGLVAVSVASVAGLYASEAERQAAAAFSAANRLARAFDGPASGSSVGALTMTEVFGVLAILIAIMSIQAITRHTRQEEETGRAELVGSTVVGRHARLTAALILAVVANLAVTATITAVLIGQDLPLEGALAAGAALGAVGVSFAAVAAVTAQLSESQRGANGLASVALGVAFLLRVVGDVAGHVAPSGDKLVSAWPSWLSPIGWGQQVRPFSENVWEVFGLYGALVVVLVAAAYLLSGHRDVAAGLLATRPGPEGTDRLSSPLALAWRLQRGVVAAWAVALVTFGGAFGALGDGADELVGLSDELAAAFEQMATDGTLLDAYFAFIMSFLGVATAGFTVQSLLRIRTEEATGRLEPVLAGAVGRRRWLAANVGLTLVGTAGLLVLSGLAAGTTYWLVTGDPGGFGPFLAAAAVQIPAAFTVGALVIAVFGIVPRLAAGIGWSALAISLVLGQLGQLLDLPDVVLNMSPFTHLPAVPAESFTATPVVVLLAVAVLLAGTGAEVFRRRDLVV